MSLLYLIEIMSLLYLIEIMSLLYLIEILSLLYYVITSIPLVVVVICTRIGRGLLDVVITCASCLCADCYNLTVMRAGSKGYTKGVNV